MNETVEIGIQHRAATFAPSSFNRETRTVDVVWTTGAQVRRYSWARDEEFDEELLVEPSALRLGRLNSGAPFLNSHRSYGLESILGVVVEGSVRVNGGRGYATIRFSERPQVEGIIRDIEGGIIRNVSVGYRVHRFERVAAADRKDGGARALMRAVDWEPLEISAVAVGADAAAQVRGETADLAPVTIERKRHMDGTTTSGTAAQTTTLTRADNPDAQEIRTIFSRHGMAQRGEALVDAGATLDQAREALLADLVRNDPAGRTTEAAPRSHVDRRAELRDAMTDGLMTRFDPRHSPTAGRQFAGMSFSELAAECLRAAGENVPVGGPSRVIDAALGMSSRSVGYHSTSDFPAVLGNAVGRRLMTEYEAARSALMVVGREVEARDFRKIAAVRLSGSVQLDKVLESGEFTHGTLEEGQETMQLATYGKTLAVTRQLIVNDDLGAFEQIATKFGQGAAETEAKILVGLFEANAGAGINMADGNPLFHASRNNILTPSAIDPTSVAEAFATMRRFKGLGGETINVTPAYLIVPPELEAEALQVVADFYPAITTDVNPFSRRLEVLVEPRLADDGRWYVSAAAGRPDTLLYAYLAGERGVQIASRVGFDVDGMEFRARLDFGGGFADWRGMVTNAGA